MTATAVDALSDIVLPDHEGRDVRLGDLWADQTAVLFWLRHYGWIHCREYAVQLHRRAKEMQEAGAKLVLIGQATPRHAAHFRRSQKLDLPVLADEDRTSYRAAGLRRGGVGQLLSPSVVTSGIAKAVRTRQVQGRPVGDVAQLGGAYVVAPGGELVWSHVAKDAADNPSIDEILAQLAAG